MTRTAHGFGAAVVLAGVLMAAAATAQTIIPGKDVPFVPTPQAAVDKMLQMAKAGPQDILYDLGSGDGRIVVTAASRYGVRKAVGIDIDPVRVAEGVQAARAARVTDRTQFMEMNLRDADFSEATVLTMYLLPSVNLELRPRILSELRPGTRVVSHQFTMGDWEPDERAEVEGRRLFAWIVPAKVGGTWQWSMGGETWRANLGQQYQNVGGNLFAFNNTVPLRSATLTGNRLSFATVFRRDGVDVPVSFVGQVSDGALNGTFKVGEETAEIAGRKSD